MERVLRSTLDLIEAMALLRDGGSPDGLLPSDCAWRGFLRPDYLLEGMRLVTRLAPPSRTGLAFTVTCVDEEDQEPGEVLVDLPPEGRVRVPAACSAAVLAVARELGMREPLSWLVLAHADVESGYRKLGLGAALYREAVRVSWQCFGSLLVADACAGGVTSSDARRVWGSRRFRDDPRIAVSGLVAGWRDV